jgi:hypothetical protein
MRLRKLHKWDEFWQHKTGEAKQEVQKAEEE